MKDILKKNMSLEKEILTLKKKIENMKDEDKESNVYLKRMLNEYEIHSTREMIDLKDFILTVSRETTIEEAVKKIVKSIYDIFKPIGVAIYIPTEEIRKLENIKDFTEYFREPIVLGKVSNLTINEDIERKILTSETKSCITLGSRELKHFEKDNVKLGLCLGILGDLQALIIIEDIIKEDPIWSQKEFLSILTIVSGIVLFNLFFHDKARMTLNVRDDKIQKLQHEREFDKMTGIGSKTALEEYVKYLEKENTVFSVIYFDADYFKKINDTWGHSNGDIVLIGLAKMFDNACNRVSGKAFRYGGDEFIGVTTSSLKYVETEMENFRKEVESNPFILDGNEVYVTVSVGVATEVINYSIGSTWADKYLYDSKKKGRNSLTIGKCGEEKVKVDIIIEEDRYEEV